MNNKNKTSRPFISPTNPAYVGHYSSELLFVNSLIASCIVQADSSDVGAAAVISKAQILRIQDFLKNQVIPGYGTYVNPDYNSIICSQLYIKDQIPKLCLVLGYSYEYKRCRLQKGSDNTTLCFKHIKLNPMRFKN